MGQHCSPSHGASLDLTVIQVQQDEKFWRQQSRIEHILWLFKEKSAAPCPIHGAGEWRKRRGLTPVPPQRDGRQSGRAAVLPRACWAAAQCRCAQCSVPWFLSLSSRNGHWHPLRMGKKHSKLPHVTSLLTAALSVPHSWPSLGTASVWSDYKEAQASKWPLLLEFCKVFRFGKKLGFEGGGCFSQLRPKRQGIASL